MMPVTPQGTSADGAQPEPKISGGAIWLSQSPAHPRTSGVHAQTAQKSFEDNRARSCFFIFFNLPQMYPEDVPGYDP